MRTSSRYLAVFFLVTISLSGAVAGINWLVDPYGFFGTPVIHKFNLIKPEMDRHEKILKAHQITRLLPQGLVLGASNSDVGLDPDHPGWSVDNVYNLSVGQNSISLAYKLLRHAAALEMPKQIVLGVEPGMFNPAQQFHGDFNPASLVVNEDGSRNRDYSPLNYYATALSLNMLESSANTVIKNISTDQSAGEYKRPIGENGLMNPESFPVNKRRFYRSRFQPRITEHIQGAWAPVDQLLAIEDFSTTVPFDLYRKIIRFACDNSIDLHIIISPAHVYMAEAKDKAGLWPMWERWKHALVLVTESEAEIAGCARFPLWDFSDYNDMTMESIAASNAPADAPRWYWDSVHYRKIAGDRVLDRVFSLNSADSFGVRLSSDNIDAHLRTIRAQAVKYRASHADEVNDVAETVRAAIDERSGTANQN